MDLHPANSSNISGLHYDQDRQVLTVKFTSGGLYTYQEVPADVYEDFRTAPSPGRYFADNIKGAYAYTRAG